MSLQLWLKSGFRYGLSYIVVSVLCAILIVIGNDLLMHSVYRGQLCDTILELDYKQWLPVCALALAGTFAVYLLLYRLYWRFPVWISGLLCGIISIAVVTVAGIAHASFPWSSWYELKNLLSFFLSGFALAVFAELID